MLSKGLKDEKKQEIEKALNVLLNWSFIPENWQKDREYFSLKLKEQLGYSLDELIFINENNLKEAFLHKNFDVESYEKLADVLGKLLPFEKQENQKPLAEKIIFIYETAQEESKIFSFDRIQKINATKKYSD